jgi:hypothetical protein
MFFFQKHVLFWFPDDVCVDCRQDSQTFVVVLEAGKVVSEVQHGETTMVLRFPPCFHHGRWNNLPNFHFLTQGLVFFVRGFFGCWSDYWVYYIVCKIRQETVIMLIFASECHHKFQLYQVIFFGRCAWRKNNNESMVGIAYSTRP